MAGNTLLLLWMTVSVPFVQSRTEYADFFTKDQTVEMKISGISGSYSVIPYQMDNWKKNAIYVL